MLLRREMEDSKVDADERSRGVAQDAEELSMMAKSNSRCLVYNTEIERERGGKERGENEALRQQIQHHPFVLLFPAIMLALFFRSL